MKKDLIILLSFLFMFSTNSTFAQELHPGHGTTHSDCSGQLLCGYVGDFTCCSNLSGLGCCTHEGQANVCENSTSCNADDSNSDLIDCSSYSDPNTCPIENICSLWSANAQPTCQLYSGSCTCVCPEVIFDLPPDAIVCAEGVTASSEYETCDCPGPIDGFTILRKIKNEPYDLSTHSCPEVYDCIKYDYSTTYPTDPTTTYPGYE